MTTIAEQVLDALRSYDLQGRGGQYRCNSPLRPGSNSHGFSVVIEGDEEGAFRDFVTGESGSLVNLAERLGIPVPERPQRVQVETSKRPYRDLADYAALKGVPPEAFIAAGWHEAMIKDQGKERPALEFPTRTGNRYRFLDGENPKFKSVYQYKPCWYGLQKAVRIADETAQPLVICNGEPSVVVAQHFGMAACAITNGEAKNIPEHLLDELTDACHGVVVVALDCDDAGRRGAAKYSEALASRRMDYVILDLGLSDSGDLADFCKLHTSDCVAALAKLTPVSRPPSAEAPPLPTAALSSLVSELIGLRRTEQSADVVIARLRSELDSLEMESRPDAVISMGDLVDQYKAQLADAQANPGKIRGMRTHLATLDKFIGGWQSGRLHILIGETGTGKTTCAASIVSSFIEDAPGMVVPTEGTPAYWLSKLVAARASINTEALEAGALDETAHRRVQSELTRIQSTQVHIYDCQSPTPDEIRAFVQRGISEHGYKWLLLDSLSNLSISGNKSIFDTTSAAADFALEMTRLGLVVIATAQVGRNLEDKAVKMPGKHSAKGSGRLEDNADVLLGLYNHQQYVDAGQAEENALFPAGTLAIRCLKHRHKGASENKHVTVVFRPGIGIYEFRSDHK